jgi:hypothetical protein
MANATCTFCWGCHSFFIRPWTTPRSWICQECRDFEPFQRLAHDLANPEFDPPLVWSKCSLCSCDPSVPKTKDCCLTGWRRFQLCLKMALVKRLPDFAIQQFRKRGFGLQYQLFFANLCEFHLEDLKATLLNK